MLIRHGTNDSIVELTMLEYCIIPSMERHREKIMEQGNNESEILVIDDELLIYNLF
jgi:hypothetical protein